MTIKWLQYLFVAPGARRAGDSDDDDACLLSRAPSPRTHQGRKQTSCTTSMSLLRRRFFR
eukprot:3246763-Rhodomonas_salina.1